MNIWGLYCRYWSIILIGFGETLDILANDNCGGFNFQTVDFSFDVFWDQILFVAV